MKLSSFEHWNVFRVVNKGLLSFAEEEWRNSQNEEWDHHHLDRRFAVVVQNHSYLVYVVQNNTHLMKNVYCVHHKWSSAQCSFSSLPSLSSIIVLLANQKPDLRGFSSRGVSVYKKCKRQQKSIKNLENRRLG